MIDIFSDDFYIINTFGVRSRSFSTLDVKSFANICEGI